MKYRVLIYILGAIFLSGCSALGHWQEIMTLKRLGQNRRQSEQYIEKQENLFFLLLDDVKNNRLEEGLSKRRILKIYGAPVLCRDVSEDDNVVQELLYRYPTQYFSSPRIYMYFNRAEKLVRWQYYPAQ